MDAIIESTPRLSFSKVLPFLQTAWDSTSLGELKTCPRKYYYNIILGSVHRIESVHLRFGLEFHAALELYDRERAMGADHEYALREAIRSALMSTWDQQIGRPWTSDEPTKTRETLIRSIIWYLDQFENDPCVTIILANGQPAVEQSFRFETGLTSITGEPIIMCGHLDRLVNFNDAIWIIDRKTTKTTLSNDFFDKYSPDNQMSMYTLAGQLILDRPVAGLLVDAAQIAVTFTRFQRQPITRTRGHIDEWFRDAIYWIMQAQGFAEKNYWPLNDKACNLYGGCPYRPVCATSPELRDRMLNALYTKREWDPLKIRGDI